MMAAEMAVIRLTHVADLPAPEELLRRLQDSPPPPDGGKPATSARQGGHAVTAPAMATAPGGGASGGASGGSVAALAAVPAPGLAIYHDFDAVVALIRERRDMSLLVDVETHLRLVRYAPGRIEFEPGPEAPADLAARLAGRLQGWTGARWGVSVASGGAPSIAEARAAEATSRAAQALDNPLVQAVLAAFPKARIAGFREPEPVEETEAAAVTEAPPDDWDPFEDD